MNHVVLDTGTRLRQVASDTIVESDAAVALAAPILLIEVFCISHSRPYHVMQSTNHEEIKKGHFNGLL